MTESEAKAMVAQLAVAFPHAKIVQATIDVYVIDLIDLETDTAKRVIAGLRRSAKFFPTIRDIRRAYAAAKIGAPSRMEAWAQAQGPREQRHPLVHQAKKRSGDESDWRETPNGIMRKVFLENYEELVDDAMMDIVAPDAPRGIDGARLAQIEAA